VNKKIVPLTTAVSAIVAASTPAANASVIPAIDPIAANGPQTKDSDLTQQGEIVFTLSIELQGEAHEVLLRRTGGPELFAGHGSHSSHGSHGSHRSGR
jgi:hypothetical protein